MLQKEKAAALLHSSLEDQNSDALLCQNVRRRGGEHRNIGVGVGSVVGGQGLHVGVHGLGHLFGDGHGLHDGACAHNGVAAGEHALAGGAAVLVDGEQAALVGLDAGGGLDEGAFGALTHRDDDAGVGVEGLAALYLGELAVLALHGVAADDAVLTDLHRSLAEAEAHALELCVPHLVLRGADALLVAAGVAGDVACAVADGSAGAVHGGVAHADDGDVVAQLEGLGVGQIVDAEGRVAQRLALDVHGVGLPQTSADKDALVAVPEEVIDGDGLADGGIGAYEEKLKEMGVPIVARVNAGCMEGGDFWMIDEHTLAFGQVDRTDQAGVDNLRDQLQKFGYTVVGVPCPPDNLHLDMIFNIVAPQVALACIDQLPYNFLQMLKRRNFELIPVASEDMYKHGCNVQCIGNGKVVAIEKNKHINDKMRALGLDVIDVPLDQILHAGGGPHCLTQPIERP